MRDKRIPLKVKIKSLACEAVNVRKEERKAEARGDWDLWFKLNDHRRIILRREARLAQLAYAAIRDIPYEDVEPTGYQSFDKDRLHKMILRFGVEWDVYFSETLGEFHERERLFVDKITAWLDEADEVQKRNKELRDSRKQNEATSGHPSSPEEKTEMTGHIILQDRPVMEEAQ